MVQSLQEAGFADLLRAVSQDRTACLFVFGMFARTERYNSRLFRLDFGEVCRWYPEIGCRSIFAGWQNLAFLRIIWPCRDFSCKQTIIDNE